MTIGNVPPSAYPIRDASAEGAGARAWHVAIHGQKHGPMECDMLITMMRAKQVPQDALVWTHGMQQWQAATSFPDFADAMGVPMRSAGAAPANAGDDTIATIVPFRNSFALIGYYVSIAALIPGVGVALAPVAIFFGIKGLKARRANPSVHGTAHAWVAIILGSIITLVYVVIAALALLSIAGVLK